MYKITMKTSYYHEISSMMYGYGDSHEPNPDTVRLVENIVSKQLRMIINEALKYWDNETLKGQDLVFLLRHNKYKMQRFIRYIEKKEATKKSVAQSNSEIPIVEVEPEKSKNNLIQFIEKIDETGEFMDLSEVDEVKLERQIRADRTSQDIDEKKYLEFQKARCASFKSISQGIKQWIDPQDQLTFEPDALEVLAYFANQTVAEIVDLALLVKEDAKSGTDPLAHLPGSYYTATMFNGAYRFDSGKPDYTRVRSGQPPISVNEIKEVMRRIYSPQAGKLNFGGKVPDTHYILAL
ncbi:unnamed protein product [Ceutorhynchus assimilis]|uniref:Transcription initiation protein SPT3 homolog n=1 Tax=Ceutorhynchus assimilis TaxID=467358 RepID=A0A9P0DDC8_9CUCU|nr:unnamed protein product [Ceutorhynchus assimilis]